MDGYKFREIVEKGFMSPSKCDVFDEDLLYFFYGRPAFRKEKEKPLELSARSPIVVIFFSKLLKNSCRLYPFDSGAFADGRYKTCLHNSMKLSDFELECSLDAPQKHVSAFFKTNINYLNLKNITPTLSYTGEYEVESIVKLLNTHSGINADDRKMAVEMQISKKIPFDKSSILAIIVPEDLEAAPYYQKYIAHKGVGVEIIKYDYYTSTTAESYQRLLEKETRDFQKRRNFI